MTYYFLAADGSTAGPETLEALTALVASGAISLATLVVPAGGEDWTPLARVLRFYYPDETGATAGPVAFSELHRLNQIAALGAETWVMELGGTEWKALSAVLAAGGVEAIAPPVAAPALPRTATGAYRPPASGHTHAVAVADPYAAPRAQGGHRVVVRHKPVGGIERMPFFLLYFLTFLLDFVILFAFIFSKSSDRDAIVVDFWQTIIQSVMLALILYILTIIATTWLSYLRLKNIGLSTGLILIHILPAAALFLPQSFRESSAGSLTTLVLLLVALLLFAILLILPQGFARHRRMDTAAWLNMMLIPLACAGIYFGLQKLEKDSRERQERMMKKLEADLRRETPKLP